MSLDDLPTPPLYSEDYLSARVLDILRKHCAMDGDELDSHGIPAHADLMTLCEESGLIEITGQKGTRIFAKLTAEGHTLLERLEGERENGTEA